MCVCVGKEYASFEWDYFYLNVQFIILSKTIFLHMHICPVCLINKFSYLFFLTNKLAKIYLPKHINKDSQPKKKKKPYK